MAVAGKWETWITQTVDAPAPGIDHALVIAGSDKRGTIFGIYDLSSQIGVSPWYWFADVPVKEQANLFVLPGPAILRVRPAVKYRGIFFNDEAAGVVWLDAQKIRWCEIISSMNTSRADSSSKGQLHVARDVGQRLQRRRQAESHSCR